MESAAPERSAGDCKASGRNGPHCNGMAEGEKSPSFFYKNSKTTKPKATFGGLPPPLVTMMFVALTEIFI